jgi:BirA family biotin operon repressor/biotin-[acetyl-CoA-carboxylase] ligase
MYIARTNSTNTLLKQLAAEGNPPEFIYAGYQTAGRGQTGNSWESEEGKNLLCSILLPPNKNLHFLNIAVGVALLRVIGEDFTIKWPNDIYWKDKKVAGILVENAIVGSEVKYSIAGIGLNVNQTEFKSDAPNPISLKQIYGTDFVVDELMQKLYAEVQRTWEEDVWAEYKAHLYRREGFWPFEDKNGIFEAAIQDVLPTGEIVLKDRNNKK